MPKSWDNNTERLLMMLVSAESDLKPSTDLWNRVAQRLGGGLTASAVSYAVFAFSLSQALLLAQFRY